jgi:hypothetical protein
MTITSVKTYNRISVDTTWGQISSTSGWEELSTSFKSLGKVISTVQLTSTSPLTRTATRTFINQAAFDEWHSNPVVEAVHVQQRGYEMTNNITWTRVITNDETGATTTESSTDFALSLSKG